MVRLIEGRSTDLTGRRGVSVLFASPGLARDARNFAKVESRSFVLPVWSLAELQAYNGLLDKGVRLPEATLRARFHVQPAAQEPLTHTEEVRPLESLQPAAFSAAATAPTTLPHA